MTHSSLNVSFLGKTVLEERLVVSVKFYFQKSKAGNEHEDVCPRKTKSVFLFV